MLLRPDALRLERANPAHLAGRKEDIEQLSRLCREESLVFLEGESGSGKSALLQAGLVPALKNDPSLLPIYVESLVGSDWERDPRRYLAAALWSSLDEAARALLGVQVVPGPESVRAAIEAIPVRLGRTPLLLIDQFDDYQNRHRERFLSRKTWLKPARLADQNGFWRDVRELLEWSAIHLVVVTRTDTAAGLTSVRFIEPETYRLDRLSSHFVGPLLAELTADKDGQKVVSDPEYGWTLLQARLSADLDHAGTILPQQLKIVLAGLMTLPQRVLSIASYERAGGAAGLEARFIEDGIAKAARLHGVTEERVRTALLTLVDPVTSQKTVERGTRELLSFIDPAAPDKARPVLDLLSQEEVIRRRVDPGTGQVSWLLDHDYLAHAVREADRRANRWQRTLAEGAKALAEAGGSWARWWRALLSPRTQLAFFWDRLRGRFRYGDHRVYAAKSLPRFGLYVAILLVVIGLSAYEGQRRSEQRIQSSADNILNELSSPGSYEDHIQTLLRLASADEAVRRHVLTLVVMNSSRALLFLREPEMVMRSLAGLPPRFRDWAKDLLVSAANRPDARQAVISEAIADAAGLLKQAEAVPLAWWLGAVNRTTDQRRLDAALRAVAAKLNDRQAKEVIEPFLTAIKNTTNPLALHTLGEGLGVLPAGFTDRQAQEAVKPFLTAFKSSTDRDALEVLSAGLQAVTTKLSDGQAQEAVELFLAAIKSTTDPKSLRGLGTGLRALPGKPANSQIEEALAPFLAALKSTTDPGALWALADELKVLPVKLTDSEAREVVEPFLAALKSTTNPLALRTLGEGLGVLPAGFTDSQAQEALGLFFAAITSAMDDPSALVPLGQGLESVVTKLSDNQAKEAVEPFLTAIKSATNFDALRVLIKGLGALPATLTDSQAREAIGRFVAAVKSTANPVALFTLADGLVAVTARLDESEAEEAVERFLAAVKSTANLNALWIVGKGLGALPVKLSDTQARETIERFIAAIKSTTDPVALSSGRGWAALPAKLSDSQAKEAVEPFLAAIRSTTEPYKLSILGEGLLALSTSLSDIQARETIEQFLAALNQPQGSILREDLETLSAKLSDSQAKEAVEPFLAAIRSTTEPYKLSILGEVLLAISAKLDRTSAAAVNGVVNEMLDRRGASLFPTYATLSARLMRYKPPDQEVAGIFRLLRHPLSTLTHSTPANATNTTNELLAVLEQVSGVDAKFDGDLWKAVEWAQAEQKAGRLRDIDLDAPFEVVWPGLRQ